MPHHVIQSLLKNSIHVDRFLAAYHRIAALFFISYNDPGLLSELLDIPLQGFLQAVIVEDGRVQRLGQASQALQSGLGDLAHLG